VLKKQKSRLPAIASQTSPDSFDSTDENGAGLVHLTRDFDATAFPKTAPFIFGSYCRHSNKALSAPVVTSVRM
jgi:hypothetical protein